MLLKTKFRMTIYLQQEPSVWLNLGCRPQFEAPTVWLIFCYEWISFLLVTSRPCLEDIQMFVSAVS